MRKLFLILFTFGFFTCCQKNTGFDSFDYTFAGSFSTVFSIKFTGSDTIYLREHWDNEYDEETNHIKTKRIYFAVVSKQKLKELKDLLNNIKFEDLEDEYFEDYLDGSSYDIFIKRDSFKKNILVHSHKAPKELNKLSKWIIELKNELEFKEISKDIKFNSYKVYEIPLPPSPPIKGK